MTQKRKVNRKEESDQWWRAYLILYGLICNIFPSVSWRDLKSNLTVRMDLAGERSEVRVSRYGMSVQASICSHLGTKHSLYPASTPGPGQGSQSPPPPGLQGVFLESGKQVPSDHHVRTGRGSRSQRKRGIHRKIGSSYMILKMIVIVRMMILNLLIV